jgi:hypothetical protein
MLETRGFPSLSHGRFGFFLMLLLAGKVGLRLSFRRCDLRYVSLEIIGEDELFRLKSAGA